VLYEQEQKSQPGIAMGSWWKKEKRNTVEELCLEIVWERSEELAYASSFALSIRIRES